MNKIGILALLMSSPVWASDKPWHVNMGVTNSDNLQGVSIGGGCSGKIIGVDINHTNLRSNAKFKSGPVWDVNLEAGYKFSAGPFQLKPYLYVGKVVFNGTDPQGYYVDDAYQYGWGFKGAIGYLFTDLQYGDIRINTYDDYDSSYRAQTEEEVVRFKMGVTF